MVSIRSIISISFVLHWFLLSLNQCQSISGLVVHSRMLFVGRLQMVITAGSSHCSLGIGQANFLRFVVSRPWTAAFVRWKSGVLSSALSSLFSLMTSLAWFSTMLSQETSARIKVESRWTSRRLLNRINTRLNCPRKYCFELICAQRSLILLKLEWSGSASSSS